MKHDERNSGLRRDGGFASVEFVIVTPVLLFVTFAIAEVGRALVQYATLANAVRNSVRFVAGEAIQGSTGVVSVTGLQTQGKNLVAYGTITAGTSLLPGLSPAQVTVTSAGNNVTVQAVYPYSPLTGSSIPTFGVTRTPISLVFNMTVTSTMQALP
jgi:Flp pilus assembly protein TadG